MKKLRRASRKNVFQRTPEVVETNTVVLDETGEIVTTWEIDKDEHTLLIAFPDTETAKVFENVAAYVENNTGTLDYYGIDLYHTMFTDITEQQTKRTAQNLSEAQELTATLVNEINDRTANSTKGNKIRVLIKDGQHLFTLTDPDHPEQYTDVLSNIKFVLEHGAAVGVTVFMEVDTDTVEQEVSEYFTDAVILK